MIFFYTFGYNAILLYFLAQIIPVLSTGNSLRSPSSSYPIKLYMCVVLVIFYSLAIQNDPGSSCIYSVQVLKSGIFHKALFFVLN